MAELEGKIALITGASRGIGAAVAKRFAAEGAHVILVARTVGALEALDDEIKEAGGKATLVPLDLKEGDLIDQLGATLFERYGKLDILVGNAGQIGNLGPITHSTPKQWNDIMAVNVTANYRLIRSMHPLLSASDAGRAIFVTSSVGGGGERAYWGMYGSSKAALEHLVNTYALEVAETPIKVNMVNPGATRTAMRARAFPSEDPATLKTPESITDVFVELASSTCRYHAEIMRAA